MGGGPDPYLVRFECDFAVNGVEGQVEVQRNVSDVSAEISRARLPSACKIFGLYVRPTRLSAPYASLLIPSLCFRR